MCGSLGSAIVEIGACRVGVAQFDGNHLANSARMRILSPAAAPAAAAAVLHGGRAVKRIGLLVHRGCRCSWAVAQTVINRKVNTFQKQMIMPDVVCVVQVVAYVSGCCCLLAAMSSSSRCGLCIYGACKLFQSLSLAK